jgi:hypothetical protein
MARVVGASSSHGVVVMRASGAPVSCLLREGRSEPPYSLEVVWNSSVESSIMAHSGDVGSLWVEHMKAAPKSAMNSRLSKQMVSPREKPPHMGRSLLAEMMSMDD